MMKLWLFDHIWVEFLFSKNAIGTGLTMPFKNIHDICRVVKKSSQFVTFSGMFYVITFFVPLIVLQEQVGLCGGFLVISLNVRHITLLSPRWASACCYCKLSCSNWIWPLTHICFQRHAFNTFFFFPFLFFCFSSFYFLLYCWQIQCLTFRVGTHKPGLARSQSSWSSMEGSCQAAGGEEMTWSHCHLFPKSCAGCWVAPSPGHLVVAGPNHAGCWAH